MYITCKYLITLRKNDSVNLMEMTMFTDYILMGEGVYIHDDVIKWKHFPPYWPFVRETIGHLWIPLTKPVTRSFGVFFYLRLTRKLVS